MISRPLFTFYTAHYNLHQERPECPERDNDAHDTLKHAPETQAAAGSRPPSLTLSHGTLSPTHTDTDKSSWVRKKVNRAGANSSKLRTRNLANDGRLSTLVSGVEERAAATHLNRERQMHGEVMSASARLRRQLQNRARAGAGSPRTLGTFGAQRQTCTGRDQRRR